MTSRARAALPWGADEIQEHYQDFGIIPDFTRLVRAKISRDEFDGYATRLGLLRSYATDREPTIHWPSCDKVWWTPPDDLTNARFQYTTGKEYFALATYHDGYVYFAATAW